MKEKTFDIDTSCKSAGVYAIVNMNSGKIYIGSSKNIANRLKQHKNGINGFRNVRGMTWDYGLNNNSFAGFPVYTVSNPEHAANAEKVFIRAIYDHNKESLYNQRIESEFILDGLTTEMEEKIDFLQALIDATETRRHQIVYKTFDFLPLRPRQRQDTIQPVTKEVLIDYCHKNNLFVNTMCIDAVEA